VTGLSGFEEEANVGLGKRKLGQEVATWAEHSIF
jgi:hypothetical protein